MTLLTALNAAQRALSLAVSTSIVSSSQETQKLLYQLANDEAAELLERDEFDFPLLRRTQSFSASLVSLQSGGKPADFQRAIPGTFWNATRQRKIYGPLNDQEWALANGDGVNSATWQSVMFRHDGLHIFPAPSVADTISYDYIINTPVLDSDGVTYKSEFEADNDAFVLGDRILRLGVIWRYKQAKGRDYAEDMKTYELALAAAARAQQGAARVLSIAPEDVDWPPDGVIPDSGFGA